MVLSPINLFFPFAKLDRVRDQIHQELNSLSTDVTQLFANNSSNFVWLDEPEAIIEAVKIINNKL